MTATILCAIDEQTAPDVVGTAGELGARLGSRTVLAHVAEDPPLFNSHAKRARERNRATKRGRASLDGMRDQLPEGLEVAYRVELGSPDERLPEIARDEDAELIVVGSRGRGALRSALLGSVSRALVEQAPCPVMIVTPGAVKHRGVGPDVPGGPEPSIVCGVDGSEPSLRAARLAGDLADRLGDRLLLVHAQDAPRAVAGPSRVEADDDAAEVLKEALDEVAGHGMGLIVQGPAAYALESTANRERARMIVVGARGIGRLRSALLGSVSAQLVGIAGCPVLVLPEQAQLDRGSRHYEIHQAG